MMIIKTLRSKFGLNERLIRTISVSGGRLYFNFTSSEAEIIHVRKEREEDARDAAIEAVLVGRVNLDLTPFQVEPAATPAEGLPN